MFDFYYQSGAEAYVVPGSSSTGSRQVSRTIAETKSMGTCCCWDDSIALSTLGTRIGRGTDDEMPTMTSARAVEGVGSIGRVEAI